MAELYVKTMTYRQILRHNRMVREESISRGKIYFTAACRKHGETLFKLERSGDKISHRCVKCLTEKAVRRKMKKVKDTKDYERKLWNREQLYTALRAGKNEVDLKCINHGLTLHSIESSSKRTYCRICHRDRVYRYRAENGRGS